MDELSSGDPKWNIQDMSNQEGQLVVEGGSNVENMLGSDGVRNRIGISWIARAQAGGGQTMSRSNKVQICTRNEASNQGRWID